MADDKQLLIGKWTVWVKDWIWEYEFSSNGTVAWKDTRSLEKGSGNWSMSSKLVNLSWLNSTTRESWHRPLDILLNKKTFYSSTYFTGPYQIEKVRSVTPGLPSGIPVNPEIANLSWDKYVDQYADCKYDLNYKISQNVSFGYSSILQLSYDDGVNIELDFGEIEDRSMPSDAARNAMAQGYLGRGGRIFPRVLAPATVPRLWMAKSKALADQDKDFKTFAGVGMAGVAFVLSVPAMPAGLPPPAGVTVGKTRVPGVSRTAGAALPVITKGSEVTEEVIRNALRGDQTRTLQGKVSLPAVQRYVDRLLKGDVPPAIKMDGQTIVEGNHRYVAAKVLGKNVPTTPWRSPGTKTPTPIEQIQIDKIDWGNR